MNTSTTETRQELAQLRRKVQVYYTAHTVLYAAALLLLIWKPTRMAGLVLGVANMAFYFLWLRGKVKGYSTAATQANIRLGICAPLTDAALTGRSGITAEDLDRWQFLPRRLGKGSSLLVQNGFTGKLDDGQTVSGTEVTLHYPYETAGGKETFSFLNGTLLWTTAPAPEQGDWLLYHKGMLHELSQRAYLAQHGYFPVELGEDGLGETFECYSHTEGAQLPDYLARRLEKIAADSKTLGAVRICEQGSMLFFRNRFYTVTLKVRDLPEEKELEANLLPERDEVFGFFRWQQKAQQ